MISFKKLFSGVDVLGRKNVDDDFIFEGVSFNSKTVAKDFIFFCFKGEKNYGVDFVDEAINNGAKAIVVEEFQEIDIPQILVKNSRSAFSLACKNLYDKVCDNMKIVGVTGTNGKTTTSHIIAHILNYCGKSAGIIGTNGAIWNGKKIDFSMTTPDPNIMHKIFLDMFNDGIEYVVMEVSAHAIKLNKLDGIKFQVAVATNITQDHLDYFKTFDNYKNTKLDFLNSDKVLSLVINNDDKNIREGVVSVVPQISYAISNPADCFAFSPLINIKGSSFILNFMDNIIDISTNLCGKYNIENVMASFCACSILGLKFSEIQEAIATFRQVDGRFNVYSSPKGYNVVIDYAHTPDGLEQVLKTAGGVTAGKLICVFGCGGDRDKDKRAKMAEVAEKHSDFVVVTSDNPRFENPQSIIDEICLGFKNSRHMEIVDRESAIEFALNLCGAGDLVCVCGKGNEAYIDSCGHKISYSDQKIVKKYL